MSLVRRFVPLSQVKQQPVRWLWRDRIPLGALTLLDGDPGHGKSLLTYNIAARVSAGQPMPFEKVGLAPASVLLLQAEDDLGSKVRTSLSAVGADLDRILVEEPAESSTDDPPQSSWNLDRIEAMIEGYSVRLIVIDPLSTFLDTTRGQEQAVRSRLQPIVDMARHRDLAVIAVRHLTKGSARNPLHHGYGSGAIGAMARSGLIVIPAPTGNDPHRRILRPTKSNLSMAPALAYRTSMADGTLSIEWIGPCDDEADVLANPNVPKAGALEEAIEFLHAVLGKGPVRSSEVLKIARREGIATKTLERARKACRVSRDKHGFGRGSYWTLSLPPGEALAKPSGPELDDLVDRLCHGAPEEPLPDPDEDPDEESTPAESGSEGDPDDAP